MTTDIVQDMRIDGLETRIDRHEMLLEKLTDNQLELSSRLTELASSIDAQNRLIGEGFDLMKKVILGLMSCLTAVMVGTQVI
tara:strand:- start:71 stop:316 length:246 start_codon:yes stop_codon:yes gene_type:complete